MRILMSLFLLCVALPALAAEPPPGPPEKITLATGGRTLFNYLPIAIATQIGAFRDAGLDVTISDFPGGQKSMESLVGGSIDFAAGTYENTIFLQARGIEIVDIAMLNYSPGFIVALSKERAATYHGPADLKGLRLGVSAPGSATQRAISLLLGQAGLPPNAVSIVGVGAGAAAVSALESGQLDGFCHADPVASKVIADGYMVPIVDARTAEGMKTLYGGFLASNAVLTTPAMIASRPEAVRRMAAAIVAAMRWMHQASVDQVMAVVPPDFYGDDKPAYRASLALQKDNFSFDGITQPDAVARAWRVAQDPGLLHDGQQIDLAKTYDNRFVLAAQAH